MNNLFQKASSHWVRYSEYQYRQGEDGILYIMPSPNAKPSVYNPLEDADTLVVDMLNVGMLFMRRADEETTQEAVMEFVSKYGLLGFLTALPTTPKFTDYEAVYLPTNHFIKAESLVTDEYLAYFFPFEKLNFEKEGNESAWTIDKRAMMALAMTFTDQPMALSMLFQREYAERYDWLALQFKDLAFTFVSSFFYYEDYDDMDETTREGYRRGMAAFGGIAPTYRIALLDKPTIIWDFHSLLLIMQMMFSFMLVDEKTPLRCCRRCAKVFIAQYSHTAFCSPRCKNQHNVYKSRGRKKEE